LRIADVYDVKCLWFLAEAEQDVNSKSAENNKKNLKSAVENSYLFRLRSINTAKVWELPKVNLPACLKREVLKYLISN
jgi:hypothetical protein